MGGNEWTSTGPYQENLESAFRQAQEQKLAEDDHGFPGRDIVDLWEDDGWREHILTGGTSSVLDFYDIVDAASGDEFAMLRPLAEDEVRDWAPEGRPTREQWIAALRSGAETFPGRGTGRCTILYSDGEPSEIGYWGCTAD
ncbi:hypothetical protein [Streptomyces sp. MBT62]|uniref:hypothetical protein n=1 Tax=Streptomyces sp. MBT62 TaxID=2800410 RepID=UPI00190D6A23|nr:hypothetical protein [Streptomyces sp. MBT62]MBK3570091.1 hypothetical protein [Streptomyces sp. MBT62]